MILSRRSLIRAIPLLLAAPAIVRVASIMPIKPCRASVIYEASEDFIEWAPYRDDLPASFRYTRYLHPDLSVSNRRIYAYMGRAAT